MPKRQTKKYSRPKKLYDAALIAEENALIKKYGLKNRREVWRADYAIEKIRKIAKKLITASESEKNEFVKRQAEKGFAVNTLADVLALNKEDCLKRRLQSILVEKGLAKTYKQARQFIVHKHVMISGNVINSPAHLTTLSEESSLSLALALPIKKELTDGEKELLNKLNKKVEEEKIEAV